MTTTVVKVNRLNPTEWQANERHRYVGRYVFLRSGQYEGQSWANSGFANQIRFADGDSNAVKRFKLFSYVEALKQKLEDEPLLMQIFRYLPTKVLGCWCVNWDGLGDVVPLCHAAYLARMLDCLVDRRSVGVTVTPEGRIEPYTGLSIPSGAILLRKPSSVNL